MSIKMNMKLWMAALCVWSVCAACGVEEGFRIEGKAEGFAEGTTVALALAATHADEEPLAEAVVADGSFVLSGDMPEPRLCQLTLTTPDGTRGVAAMMVENGRISLVLEQGKTLQQGIMEVEVSGVEGSESDKLFREKMAYRAALDSLYQQMNRKYAGLMAKKDEAFRANDMEAVREVEASEEYRSYQKEQNAFFATVQERMMATFRENGDSFWGPLLTLYNVSFFPKGNTSFANLYNGFSDEAKQSFYGKILGDLLFAGSLTGKPVPAFTLPDREGKEWSDGQLREGKRCVLIDFWASWCGPCRKASPLLKALYEEYASRGLEIISISIDKDEAAWHKALDEEQFPWHNLWDTRKVFSEKYKGQAIPTFVLVDADGIVVNDQMDATTLRAAIEEQLGN